MGAESPRGGEQRTGSPIEVFLAFLKLGLTAFGGPIAHLGYFYEEFVGRRKWMTDSGYADLVALCQFLPGPTSSQVGFAIGLYRAGPIGALAAFLAFTLPSALLMIGFAMAASSLGGPIAEGVIDGLKIVAVAIVAHAVWGMARTLCPERITASIAVLAVAIVLGMSGPFAQVGAIIAGALAGAILLRSETRMEAADVAFPVSRAVGAMALAVFFALLIGLPILGSLGGGTAIEVFDAFYRSGALVFGGGHVVLPLLESAIVQPGWVTEPQFLAGYGAAQAVPGPLFTFAAYLGTLLSVTPNGLIGALIALVAIFMPGFLLLIGAMPFWDGLRMLPSAQSLMRGANAAVVGILGAALYDPVFTSAIISPVALVLALISYLLLAVWKCPPWVVVIFAALGGVVIQLMGW